MSPGVGGEERQHPHRLVEFLPLEPYAAHAAADGQRAVVALHRAEAVHQEPAHPGRNSASPRSRP
ncbi:hypothetical protein QFZ50_002925 [Arthrobacter agilis]|nr:hypothetical protein [Arthrobacter agilis]